MKSNIHLKIWLTYASVTLLTLPGSPTYGQESLTWVRTGGPPGGLGYDIRYNFADPNTSYATDNYGGVHISTDNGITWQPSNNGIPRQSGPSGDAFLTTKLNGNYWRLFN